MDQTYTQQHLLQFIYGELDYCTQVAIKKEILADPALAEEYRKMKSSVSLLNSHEMSPKPSTVNAVLKASKSRQEELAS